MGSDLARARQFVEPGTARFDRREKLPVYARAEVQRAWLIDPLAKTLEVDRLEAAAWRLVEAFGSDDLVRAEPFDAIELELAALWA